MKSETSVIGKLRKVITPQDDRFRFKLYVFLVCLGISIFLWFLIALSKESVSTLEYPIRYTNMPEDMMMVNHPDSTLTFRVASGGFEMITLKYLSRRKPIDIDLSNLNLEEKAGYFTATFSTSRLSKELLAKNKFSEELVSISPENLYFRFEPLVGKKVPVIPNLTLSFQGLYRLSDSVRANPDSVLVVGARQMLDQIRFVETEDKAVKNISGPMKVMADIRSPELNGQLKMVPQQVELTINAEKFTEATIELEVETEQNDVRVKTFPERVKVTYLVALKNYNRIDAGMFRAIVSIPQDQSISQVPVKIVARPSFTEITKIEPEQVEYLVLSND
ncbi:MAG: YbbR-like domain-containing protein [Bacteroidetes bacterium]|nr:YbbR-like domain-containing protein [Bacteroidota bacterium]